MLGEYKFENKTDNDKNPTGGWVKGVGLDIKWQDGPLGKGDDRKAPNGAFVETVLDACMKRIQFYQDSKFACEENRMAIIKIKEALFWLDSRTKRRTKEGTEGAHEGT